MLNVCALGLVASLGLGATGCSPRLDWRVVPVAEPVTALFPCRVERRARDGVPLAGLRVTMTQWSCSAEGMTFAVSHASLPAGQASTPILVAWGEVAGTNLGARPEPGGTREIRASPSPGGGVAPIAAQRLVVQGQTPDGARVRHEMLLFFAPPTGVFQASVLGTSVRADAAEVFFDGLEIKR